jgi:hypothetical protein
MLFCSPLTPEGEIAKIMFNFFLTPALLILFNFIGTVYPESFRDTLLLYYFIELLSKRPNKIYLAI